MGSGVEVALIQVSHLRRTCQQLHNWFGIANCRTSESLSQPKNKCPDWPTLWTLSIHNETQLLVKPRRLCKFCSTWANGSSKEFKIKEPERQREPMDQEVTWWNKNGSSVICSRWQKVIFLMNFCFLELKLLLILSNSQSINPRKVRTHT